MTDYSKQFSGDVQTFGHFNLIGLTTLVRKEVGRFLSVYMQTLIAPTVTMLLFYAVFSLALGGSERHVENMPLMVFIAPGLIIMAMAQNAFANTSSSLVIAKVQGNIVDVLMPPLSPLEVFIGYIFGAIIRGLIIGVLCLCALILLTDSTIYSLFYAAVFGFLGTMMLSVLGLIGGIWSDKFDHIAAVTNFIIMPLTFLSGTFYPLKALPEFWSFLAQFNPFFYMINGFRYGLTGFYEAPILLSVSVLVGVNVVLSFIALSMLRSGYKLKS